jgi:cyclic pyranopterin phosphate synthase
VNDRAAAPRDQQSRPLHDLRISVTDRCNFRCAYCMPKEVFGPGFEFLKRRQLLTYEEIARLARLFVQLGVEKIRLTGGEPLMRRDLCDLIAMLAGLRGDGAGPRDLTLTTNGLLLEEFAPALAAAGLDRVTVSLDSLDDEVFRRMNDVGVGVAPILAGIEAARQAGLTPIKVNAVVRRGLNDHTVVDLARHFQGSGVIVRFIEYMDVGTTNGWRLDEVVPAREIVERIDAAAPLEAIPANYPGEVARRWRYRDGSGEIGVIASVTQPFCGGCSRARLSPEGKLFTCLFASAGHDLREPLRAGESDDELRARLAGIWSRRDDRYSELRSAATLPILTGGAKPAADAPNQDAPDEPRRIEMSYIGG